jgi:hypothetical protein
MATWGRLPSEIEPQETGASLPVRQLTVAEAVSQIPFWIRQAFRQNVRAIDRGGIVLLLQQNGTARLVLVRRDYDRYVALLTESPWVSGYDLPEPDLTTWIEASIQAVFNQP